MLEHNPEDYTNFTTFDFVADEFFQRWIRNPDDYTQSFWQDWIARHPDKSREVSEAKVIIQNLTFKTHRLSDSEVSHLWGRVQQFDPQSIEAVGAPFHFTIVAKIAASFLLGTVLLFAFWKISSHTYLEYHTAYGETKTVVLPDGSTVILNSNSTLRFDNDWSEGGARKLWLDGEAYFSVVHKENNQPFEVNTDEGMRVEVLGTTFNVFHRTNETKVVLNTGKIKLHLPSHSAADNIIMKPGEFVEYKQMSFSKRNVNPATYTAWTQKKLLLDHTSLREMIDMLKNNYGVTVIVENKSLLNETVSGSMPLGDVESLMQQIAQAFQLKIEKQHNNILMHE